MFTGIVEGQGIVASFKDGVLCLRLPAFFGKLKKGASIAVDGACLSLVRQSAERAYFDVVEETRRRTTFESLVPGQRVNLERALSWKGRVEGHFVLGHVDGVGRVEKILSKKQEKSLLIGAPLAIRRYIREKGSIAVNGVSLTIGKTLSGCFWVHIIPHTLKKTNLIRLEVGSRVNLEADYLLKK